MSSSPNNSGVISIPADILGMYPMDPDMAYITNERYQNDEYMLSKPKGVLYGFFAGSDPSQRGHNFPSVGATYFFCIVKFKPGQKLIFYCQYPHCRYISFSAGPVAQDNSYGNEEFITGDEIVPDNGSQNPFSPGVNRNIGRRNFTLTIVQADKPENPEPNTLYIPDAAVGADYKIQYRVYLVDKGYDGSGLIPLTGSGGNGLPLITLYNADGSSYTGADILSELSVVKGGEAFYPVAAWQGIVNSLPDPTNAPAVNPPRFELQWNLGYSVQGLRFMDDPLTRVTVFPADNTGLFGGNGDTKYIAACISMNFGDCLVIRGKMPSTPKTESGDMYYEEGTQLKYFEANLSAAPPSGLSFTGTYDEKIPVVDGHYTICISRKWYRPKNATLDKGVLWLDFTEGEGYFPSARCQFGIFYFRFQGPDNELWLESPGNVPPPTIGNPVQQESVIMGDYFPVGTYMSTADFDAMY